jgi:ATP-dependent Lon protease
VRLDHLEDGRIQIVTQGEDRFVIRELSEDEPYLQAATHPLADTDEGDSELPALARETGTLFKEYISVLLAFADRWIGEFEMPAGPKDMSYFVAARLNISLPMKQRLLEMTSIRMRLTEERDLMQREIAQMEILANHRIPKPGTPLA